MSRYSRRELGKLALAALPAAASGGLAGQSNPAKPNSTWAGVTVGMNVPYSFGTRTAMSAEDVLEKCVEIGLSSVELRAQPIEKSLGLPDTIVLGPAPSDYNAALAPVGEIPGVWKPGQPKPDEEAPAESRARNGDARNAGARNVGTARSVRPQTPEQLAAYRSTAEELRKWRLAAPLSKAADLRRAYEQAGVVIDIVKFDGLADLSDEELDYALKLAKTLGARAVSGELSVPAFERLGQAADRNRMWIGLHGHVAVTAAIWEQAFSHGRYLGANVDIGHFVAGNNTSPLPFIRQHHDRITHLHVKDRKRQDGPNMPFGQGDTPIREILQTIRDNQWPIPAMIEFEIPLPAGTDRTPELLKCLEYCKQCLLS
jgi:sugar phosphate isomerase/epimerase